MAVSDTDKAVSPRDNKVSMLEVAPPGAKVSTIKPTANNGGNSSAVTNISPRQGSNSSCPSNPTSTARGALSTRRKSSTLSVMPTPSMMTNSASGKNHWVMTEVCIFAPVKVKIQSNILGYSRLEGQSLTQILPPSPTTSGLAGYTHICCG